MTGYLSTTADDAVRIKLRGTDAIDEVADAWRRVEADCPRVPLAVSWSWTATWLRHYGDTVRPRFAIAERAGVPCAVALLVRSIERPARVPVRTLHLGTAGEPAVDNVCVEYNDLLCVPGMRGPVLRELASTLAADSRWDELRIDGTAGDALAAGLAEALPGTRRITAPNPSRYFDLTRPEPGADLASALPSGPRRRLRASVRAFEAYAPFQVEWPDDPSDAELLLDELVDLHQRRWQDAGNPGSFASLRFRAFHRDLVRHGVEDGTAAVVRVRCGLRTLGVLYLLRDGDRALFYQSGVAPFDDNRLRPGLVTHALAMQACRERGFAAYDFLAGDARYKRDLSTDSQELTWTRVQRPRLRLRGLDMARKLRDARRLRGATT